jgi:urease subunit alpha
VTFVSKIAIENKTIEKYQLNKIILPVENCRNIGKKDLIHNHYQPKIEVDSQTYAVRADGLLLVCEPADVLPFAQRYFLF